MIRGNHHEHVADGLPESVSTGKGMSVRGMLLAARRWAKRQIGTQHGFGWTTLKKRQAQMRRAERARKKMEDGRLKPAGGPVDFQSARQHQPASGIKKFRVVDNDPWRRL